MLNENEKERYAKQIMHPAWGEAGQEKLKSSVVFVAGAGGLGSPVAMYLAAAGVGTLRLCDSGELELSNLNRQILYTHKDLGKVKVYAAAEHLRRLNHEIDIIPLSKCISEKSVESLVAAADLIIDCLDNFPTRFILNRYAVKHSIPLIHAGIEGMVGQLTFIVPKETPCLECLFPDAPPLVAPPVIGVAPGVIGTLEATEALKYLTGMEPSLKGRLMIWEGDSMNVEILDIYRRKECPVCGKL
jgi:molybdopterin-synthase adenylyltransferase